MRLVSIFAKVIKFSQYVYFKLYLKINNSIKGIDHIMNYSENEYDKIAQKHELFIKVQLILFIRGKR